MVGLLGALGAGVAGGAGITIIIRAVDQFSGVFAKVNKSMLLAGGAITAMGVAGAAAVGGLLKMSGQYEQTEIAFTTMLGSAEKAQSLLKELADFAAKTPFTIPGIEMSAKQMLAMGIETDKLLPTLKSIGDVAAGLSVPLDRLAYNYGQVKSQTRLTGVELRDFTRAGVPLIAELAKNIGVTEEKVKEMVSAGEIGFDKVEEAFTSMTSEGGKFFDMMDKQSKTFFGQVSNIQDSFIKLGRIMGEVFLPIAKFVAGAIQKIVEWMEKYPVIAKVAGVILGLVTVLLLIIGPLMIMGALLPLLATGWGILTGTLTMAGVAATGATVATGGLTVSMTGLAAALTAVSIAGLPLWVIIVAIIAIIAALIAITVYLVKNWDAVRESFIKFGVDIQNVFIRVRNTVVTVWNKIVSFVERSVNAIINAINTLIRGINRIPGIRIPIIPKVDLSRLKGQMMALKKYIAPTVVKPTGDVLTESQIQAKVQDIIAQYRGSFRDVKTSPYYVNNFNIENINGMTGKDLADSLQEELNKKITSG